MADSAQMAESVADRYIAHRRYTAGPSPIEFLPHLTEHLGGPDIYVKRNDQLGLTAGGNKTRKLECLMADALAQGADTIITTGAVQSNDCRLTLSAAVKGLKGRLVIEEWVGGSYDEESSGNNLLFRLLGVESIQAVPGGTDLMAKEVATKGGKRYIVPGSGSGGTHAGLVAGFYGNQGWYPGTRISVRAEKEPQEAKLHALSNETSVLSGASLWNQSGALGWPVQKGIGRGCTSCRRLRGCATCLPPYAPATESRCCLRRHPSTSTWSSSRQGRPSSRSRWTRA